MLTFGELKKTVKEPEQEKKPPTAKYLKKTGLPVARKILDEDTEIAVYPLGYALYRICGNLTVFPIHSCGDYWYTSGNNTVHIPVSIFDREPWYMRLILEGEDRLNRNQNEKEQGRSVSYSSVSEEWDLVADLKESTLEHLVRQETIKEMMALLNKKQRKILQMFFLQEKTQKQISEELHISKASVYTSISRAFHRIRERYPEDMRQVKAGGYAGSRVDKHSASVCPGRTGGQSRPNARR